MPRPLLRSVELRKRIDLYLSDAERASIQVKATGAGMPLSAFIRQSALDKKIVAVPQIAAEQWVKLSGLSANLNQIAHHLNTGNPLSAYDMVTIEHMRLQLDAIRLALSGDSP